MKPFAKFVLSSLAFTLCIFLSLTLPAQEISQQETEAIDFAHGLLEREMFDMAIAEYQKFITDYPQSSLQDEVYFSIGEAYFLSQRFPQAIEAFNTVKQKFPNSPRSAMAALRLGQIYAEQGNFNMSYNELTAKDFSGQLQGATVQAYYYYLGKAALGKKDAATALANFEKAAQVTGTNAYTSYALEKVAEIQAQDGHFNEATVAVTKALAATQDADFKRILTYKQGEILFRSGKYEESIPYFQQILDQFPNSETVFQAVSNLLLANFNLKKFEEVISVYKKYAGVVKDAENYFEAHFAAARSYAGLQQYDEALALLDKTISFPGLKNEDLCRANLQKANILIKKKEYAQGLALIENQCGLCAQEPDQINFLKAQANFGIGNFQKAYEFFLSVTTAYPDSMYASAARLGAAHAERELGKGMEAADEFLSYAESESDAALKSDAIFNAALVLAQSHQEQKAIEQAERYLKDFSKEVDYENVILLLGELYAKTSQFNAAINLLQGYLADPSHVKRMDKGQFLLGYNLQLLGKTDEALAVYEKIVADPNDQQFFLAGLKNSAAVCLSRGEESRAAVYFEKIITAAEKNDLDSATYFWVINRYLKDEKYNDVLRIVDKVAARFPDQPAQQLDYFRAEAYRGLKDFTNAQKYYDTVIASTEKNTYTAGAIIGKGLTFMATNQLDEAQKEFDKAMDDYPNDHTVTLRARLEAGNIARRQNKLDEALRFYLLVGTIYQDKEYCPQALMAAGEILEGAARKEEALKVYQQVTAQYPNSAQAPQAKEKISSLTK